MDIAAKFRHGYLALVVAVTLGVAVALGLLAAGEGWSLFELAIVIALLVTIGAASAYAIARVRACARDAALDSAREAVREATEAIVRCATEMEAQSAQADEALGRLHALLEDAVVRLSEGFGDVHRVSLSQRALTQRFVVHGIASHADDARLLREQIDSGAREFDRHVERIVTALQFQDMAAQLVENVRLRLDQSRSLGAGFDAVAAALADLARNDTSASAHQLLRRKVTGLLGQASRISNRTPVSAAQVVPGEVEMF